MCCFHWLMNKEIGLAYSKVELGQVGKTKLNVGRKKAKQREAMEPPTETDARTLPGKPQPCGDTHIFFYFIFLH